MKDDTVLSHVRLHFNINYPTLEECYLHGYESAVSEMSEETNPFSPQTKEHHEWSEGWWAGFYGEQPLFELSTQLEEQDAEAKALTAANEHTFPDTFQDIFIKVMEVAGILAVSATVGYQVLDLVA